jgi:hypothetical protein
MTSAACLRGWMMHVLGDAWKDLRYLERAYRSYPRLKTHMQTTSTTLGRCTCTRCLTCVCEPLSAAAACCQLEC